MGWCDKQGAVESAKKGSTDTYSKVKQPCQCVFEKVQYRVNGSWRDVPAGGMTDIGKDTSITFKAVYTGGDCVVTWGDDASGEGVEKQVFFPTSGARSVSVKCCGREIKVPVAVDLENATITITWDPEAYTAQNTSGPSTTIERPFTVTYTASAYIDKNKWMLRVKEIHGSVDITVKTGGSRDPIANPPTTEAEAQAAVTDMKGYYARGSRGSWHTEAASKTHEQYHYREWRETADHYWPTAETALEKIETTYHDHTTEADAIAAMRAGASGADTKIVDFKDVCRRYWMTLGDSAGDRPYAAGQNTLNTAVQSVQDLATIKGWVVEQGVVTPSVSTPCYQPWLTYNP